VKPELCHACGASLAGVAGIPRILRIDNVETRPTERITANDEDRQRQGFDIQTVFRWPTNKLDLTSVIAIDSGVQFARFDYAPRAEISRINNGLRRRIDKAIRGSKWLSLPGNGSVMTLRPLWTQRLKESTLSVWFQSSMIERTLQSCASLKRRHHQ
jgi:hypothetical protein